VRSAPTLRVWGVGTPRTLRPHWMLCELGLPYETREIIPRTDSMDDPEFAKLCPRGKVPLLQDGDLVLGESGAIVGYLADRYREHAVLAPEPATPARALCDELGLFALMELDAPLYVIRRHEGLPEIYGEAPAATRAARSYFARQAREIERRLADGRPHLLGDDFSIADLIVATCLGWGRFCGIEIGDALDAYLARMTGREGYRQAVLHNFTPAAVAALKRA